MRGAMFVALFLLSVVRRLIAYAIFGVPATILSAIVGGTVAKLSEGIYVKGAHILGGTALAMYIIVAMVSAWRRGPYSDLEASSNFGD